MNYRHIYHAGNFADVFKHAILTRILLYLIRKDAPLRYIDTHAGLGSYDLSSPEAQRGGEWREGVGRLGEAVWSPDAKLLLDPYLDLALRDRLSYPGSPLIAAGQLRRHDRLICCEAHPQDAGVLKAALAGDRRAKAIEIDGYMALRAYVPPPERRGLVLIDPPFEAMDEFDRLARAVCAAVEKWPGGVYAIWRPMKDHAALRRFDAAILAAAPAGVLRLDLSVDAPSRVGPLAGSSLLVLNPPFSLASEARVLLPELHRVLARGPHGAWDVAALRDA